ncbi:hypothetical protein [Streptomyces collinus]|uniref:hypothetical protein n=1 Tax=Streptomyces collinus TaxID=42684 RepID=UPI003EBB62DF
MTITDRVWATTSWTSRAIRARSSTTARRASALVRSCWARRHWPAVHARTTVSR